MRKWTRVSAGPLASLWLRRRVWNSRRLRTVTSPWPVAVAGGAGINSAKAVIDTGAQAVLTGNCGPNAERTLRAGNIKLYTGVTGTVAEAVAQFKAGSLQEATGPSVDSHAGMGQ